MPSHLRFAIRSLAQQPALFVAVVLAIASALAANAALFAIYDGLLFKPLPFKQADRLVHIELPTGAQALLQTTPVQRRELVQQLNETPLFAERASVLAPLVTLFEEGANTTSEWNLHAAQVAPDFFPMLGANAMYGRVLTADDEGRSSPRPIVISYQIWRDHFGADPSLPGTTIRIDGTMLNRPLVIAGVMPEGFSFPAGVNVWAVRSGPASSYAPAYARLAPGVNIEQVRAMFPAAVIMPLRDHLIPDGADAFGFVLGATGLLLLVAWVQVAALLFSRTAGRAREIGTQLALGASQRQLFAQYAAEGALVAAAALAVGWLMARPLTAVLVRVLPAEMTAGQALFADWRAFAFTAILSVAGLALLSLIPLQIVRRSSPLALMRRADDRAGIGRSRTRIALLGFQLAASAALLYVAALAAHSFVRVRSVDLGFDATGAIAFRLPNPTISTGPGQPSARAQVNAWVSRMKGVLESTREVPGVAMAASGSTYPLRGDLSSINLLPALDAGADPMTVRVTYLSPRYIETLGLRLVEGRALTDADYTETPTSLVNQAPPVALVNETLARDLARLGPVIGQRLHERPAGARARIFEVVGILGDAVDSVPGMKPAPRMFAPRSNLPYVIARLDRDPVSVIPRIRQAAAEAWPGLPLRGVVMLEDEVRRATADYRARSLLLVLISLLCLPLAATGIAGAINYATRQKTREIAVRLALGADPSAIRGRIVGGTLVTTAVALAAGTAAGMFIGQAASRYLFGVRAADLTTIAAVWIVLMGTAWLAALVPAARASRIEPAAALRE
ncbi:MAG: ABC transporter permease [Vicinamibacterales bacterium]